MVELIVRGGTAGWRWLGWWMVDGEIELNGFSDLTPEEFSKQHNTYRMPPIADMHAPTTDPCTSSPSPFPLPLFLLLCVCVSPPPPLSLSPWLLPEPRGL